MVLSNRFDGRDSIDSVAAAVRRDGYAIVERVLDEATITRLNEELAPHVARTETGSEAFWGHHTKRFGALIAKSKEAQKLVVDPVVLGVADRILLEHCASYWINYTGIMHLGPGERAQVLHRDTNLWPFTNPCPPLTLATMWAVNDFSRGNGGTLVVPGSHLWEDARAPEPEEIGSVEMPAGSVLLYTGNLIHGGGANRSNRPRFGLALHYVLGWLRQEETQLLTVSREEALALPEQVRRLMGYSLGASSLGMVDHLDPHEFLTGVREEKPHALSSPTLDANESKMKRLSVVASTSGKRTRFHVHPES